LNGILQVRGLNFGLKTVQCEEIVIYIFSVPLRFRLAVNIEVKQLLIISGEKRGFDCNHADFGLNKRVRRG
jgi:hypothetical protein